jgi:tRNA pseudouridine55 synthase
MDRILPVYKPVDMTSYDVIREFKRAVHPAYKIGHGGTLDPFADGVLLLLLGRATKQMNTLMALPKTYQARAVLGARSDTLDRTGTITEESTNRKFSNSQIATVTQEQITVAMQHFVGEIEQAIPDYSAAKVGGVPRYKLARQGATLAGKSKHVMIYEVRLMDYEHNMVTFEATVSSGTYIRQLSYDIFHSLEIESYLTALTRTAIGPYTLEDCLQISEFATKAELSQE